MKKIDELLTEIIPQQDNASFWIVQAENRNKEYEIELQDTINKYKKYDKLLKLQKPTSEEVRTLFREISNAYNRTDSIHKDLIEFFENELKKYPFRLINNSLPKYLIENPSLYPNTNLIAHFINWIDSKFKEVTDPLLFDYWASKRKLTDKYGLDKITEIDKLVKAIDSDIKQIQS